MIAMAVKQTAGRDTLGTFAPEFARLNALLGEDCEFSRCASFVYASDSAGTASVEEEAAAHPEA